MGNIFTFIPHNLSELAERAGWVYVGKDDGYSALYVWEGKGRPILPGINGWPLPLKEPIDDASPFYFWEDDLG